MDDTFQFARLHPATGQSGMLKYACPACEAAIYTTTPVNMLFLCTLCEEVLVAKDLL